MLSALVQAIAVLQGSLKPEPGYLCFSKSLCGLSGCWQCALARETYKLVRQQKMVKLNTKTMEWSVRFP
jgi:hypothetical protein